VRLGQASLLRTVASLGHTRAVARVFGVPLTGFVAWWVRRTYYLFQMPRRDRRLRIALDWASRGLTCAWNESS
jgi:NADH:quinone reductase (non-electrogenic)